MAQYGMVYDVNEIKRHLAEANRDYTGRKTWESLYGSIDLAKQQQLKQLDTDYSQAAAQAYAAAYRNDMDIATSDLGQGYKAAAIEDSDIALQEAYNAYRSNYLKGVAEVDASAEQARKGVTDALNKQAEYTTQYANAPYEYLQYLFDMYAEGSNEENIFYNEDLWKRYTNEVKDEQGNLTGERELKSWEDIVNSGAYEEITDESGNTQRQWTGLYDDKDNLTIKGADFFDQMFNQLAYEGRGVSFGQWLAENNQELYDWSQSYNPYDYTEARSNEGSFKTMVGLTSTDEKYTFMERFGGLTKSEVDGMYSRFTNKLTELNDKVNKSSGRNSKELIKEFTDLTAEIETLTNNLGITDDIESELGMSLEDLGKYLANNASDAVSNGDIWWQGILDTGKMMASSTLIGMGMGSTAFPGVGTGVGALAGLIIGTIGGVINGIVGSEQTKEQNAILAEQSRGIYDNLVTTLITYSQNKQRQAQIDYYNK